MSQDPSVAATLNAEEANQLADKAIMKHLTITIGVMVAIALVIGFVANTIA